MKLHEQLIKTAQEFLNRRGFLANNEELRLQDTFVDDLGMDSLDVIELVMTMETDYNFIFPDEQIEQIKTVQDFIEICTEIAHYKE